MERKKQNKIMTYVWNFSVLLMLVSKIIEIRTNSESISFLWIIADVLLIGSSFYIIKEKRKNPGPKASSKSNIILISSVFLFLIVLYLFKDAVITFDLTTLKTIKFCIIVLVLTGLIIYGQIDYKKRVAEIPEE